MEKRESVHSENYSRKWIRRKKKINRNESQAKNEMKHTIANKQAPGHTRRISHINLLATYHSNNTHLANDNVIPSVVQQHFFSFSFPLFFFNRPFSWFFWTEILSPLHFFHWCSRLLSFICTFEFTQCVVKPLKLFQQSTHNIPCYEQKVRELWWMVLRRQIKWKRMKNWGKQQTSRIDTNNPLLQTVLEIKK